MRLAKRISGSVARHWRWTDLRSRVAVAAIAVVLAVVWLAVAAPEPHHPDATIALKGQSIPPEWLPAFKTAARSCPTLSAARLAGQMTATSGLEAGTASGGGTSVAGLSNAAWQTWRPAPDTQRDDPGGDIVALAHQMCDLIGRLSVAEVRADPWRAALAAFRTTVDDVVNAHGVPPAAALYVDTAARYADFYQRQPEFSNDSASPSPAASPRATTLPVPVPPSAPTTPRAGSDPTPRPTTPRASRPTPVTHPAKSTSKAKSESKAKSAISATTKVSGSVTCSSGNAVTGVWIDAKKGGSGWSPWWPEANPSHATFAYKITTGPWDVHVGCGGAPDNWQVATASSWVTAAAVSFTCNDIGGQSDYGHCRT